MAYTPPNQNGQATATNSSPVVIASDQTTVKTKLATDIADVTGTITTSSSTVVLSNMSGVGAATVTIYGTYAGVTVVFEGYDGVNWVGLAAQQHNSATPSSVISAALTSNSTNRWNVSPLLGLQQFRVRSTAYTSGTASVIISPSAQFAQYQVNVATMPTTTVSGTVTSNLGTAGTAATSLGKAEDAAHASGDTGVFILGVRNSAGTAMTDTDGDYSPIGVDSTGAIRVGTISGAITPGTGSTSLGKAEDAAHASGDVGVMALAVANEALSAISGTDGDYTPAGSDRKGRVLVRQATNTASDGNVSVSTTAATLLAANTARISGSIYNDSSAVLYVRFNGTATATNFKVALVAGAYYEIPGGYNGAISGILASGTGTARVAEES